MVAEEFFPEVMHVYRNPKSMKEFWEDDEDHYFDENWIYDNPLVPGARPPQSD